MCITLDYENAIMARSHRGKTVTDKVRLGVIVCVSEYVGDSSRIGGHEPTAAEEALVDKGGAVGCFPSCEKVVVLLIVHLYEVSEEERVGWWTTKETKWRTALPNEEEEESGECV